MLKHENVVELKEAFRRKNKLYLVFEYADQNLLEVIEKQPKGLQAETVRKFVHQLCKAIHYCHGQSVLHRDIKPENLLVNAKGTLKLCDFGFSRIVPPTKAGLTDYVATRWYRPPELLLRTSDYTEAVDMWAIGCIMGELTDGQPLFAGESEFDQLEVIQKVLGPITPTQMEIFAKHPNFRGMNFSNFSKPETLDQKYLGKLSKKAMSFMKSLLKLDPNERLTAAEALRHPYFEGLNEQNDDEAAVDSNADPVENDANTKQKITPTETTHSKNSLLLPKDALANSSMNAHKEFIEKSSGMNAQKPVISGKETNKSVENNVQRGDPVKPSDGQSSFRSSSLNKNSYKNSFDPSMQKKTQIAPLIKKPSGVLESEIHSNNVPEAFLKSRYGNQQYNYNLKENNPEEPGKGIKNRIIERPRDRNEPSSSKRPTAESILADLQDQDDNLSKSPPPIINKTSAQGIHRNHAKKNSLLGNTRDISESRHKSPGGVKIYDLKKSQKPSHMGSPQKSGGVNGNWGDDADKMKTDMETEGSHQSTSQLPQLNVRYNESQKAMPEPRRNHRFEGHVYFQPTVKHLSVYQHHASSGTDYRMNEMESKHSSHNVYQYAFGGSPGLWNYKVQGVKR